MEAVPTGWRRTVIWAGLPLFIGALNEGGVAQSLPAIHREFSVPLLDVRWMVLAFLVADAAVLIGGGRLGQVLGRRRVFMSGLLAFALACLASALSFSYPMLLVTRVVAGVGAGLFFAGLLAIVAQSVPKEMLGRAFGLWALVGAVGIALSPLVGGLLTELLSWRGVLVANAVIALVALALTPRFLAADEPRERAPFGDIPGFVAISITVVAVTVGLTEVPSRGWNSPLVIGFVVVGLLALVIAIAIERRADNPLVPRSVLRAPGFLAGTALVTLTYAAFAGLVFVLPFLLHYSSDLSPIATGAVMLGYGIWWFALPPFTGRLADRVAPVKLLTIGLLCAIAGLLLLAAIGTRDGLLGVVVALSLLGIGTSFVIPTANRITMIEVPAASRNDASGVNMTARLLGSMTGIAVVGSLLSSAIGPTLPLGGAGDTGNASAGITAMWGFLAVLMLVGLILTWAPVRRLSTPT